MDDEYITREAALDIVNGWREQLIQMYGENDEYVKCLETVAEHLYFIPAADVTPVVRGRWIEEFDGFIRSYTCSECGEYALTKEETMHDEVCSNFCPNCGAKMDGGQDDA